MEGTPDRLILRCDAVDAGWSDDELGRLVRRGEWVRLGRGVYLDGRLPEGPAERHVLRVRAALARLGRSAVVSHESAAVLHRIPLWGVRLDRVHVTRRPPAWNDSRGELRVHVARLRDDEVTTVRGIAVTTPMRTLLDLARSLPFEKAVVALDGALNREVVSEQQLRDRLVDIAGTKGCRAAARAVAFSDSRSESIGESRSRVVLHRLGLPPSALQHEIRSEDGRLIGRADFAWERERVIGEFDGRIKYGRLLRPGQDPGDAVFAEKRREDEIRAEDWSFVRWTWDDINAPQHLARRLRRALGRSR